MVVDEKWFGGRDSQGSAFVVFLGNGEYQGLSNVSLPETVSVSFRAAG